MGEYCSFGSCCLIFLHTILITFSSLLFLNLVLGRPFLVWQFSIAFTQECIFIRYFTILKTFQCKEGEERFLPLVLNKILLTLLSPYDICSHLLPTPEIFNFSEMFRKSQALNFFFFCLTQRIKRSTLYVDSKFNLVGSFLSRLFFFLIKSLQRKDTPCFILGQDILKSKILILCCFCRTIRKL